MSVYIKKFLTTRSLQKHLNKHFIQIKKGGGNAGHKGLLSIDNNIGNSYNRLRVGIGHPTSKELVVKHVLDKFSSEEKKIFNKIIAILVEHIDLLFTKKELFLTKISLLMRKTYK